MTNKQIKGSAGLLNVNDVGEGGLSVVFVHSFAGDTTHWKAQLEHLRKSRRAIALDLRAHGQSDAPQTDDYSIESFAEDIASVVDELNLNRFVLVGHSMGGSASLEYADKNPQRVAGLVLTSTPGKSPAEMAERIIKSLETNYEQTMGDYWQTLVAGAQPHVLQKLNEGREKLSEEQTVSMTKAIFQYNPLPALQNYSGQKLLVTSPNDDQPFALHNLVPDAPHRTISGTSHWLQMDKPEEFNQILDDFLHSVELRQKQTAGIK